MSTTDKKAANRIADMIMDELDKLPNMFRVTATKHAARIPLIVVGKELA